MVLLLTIILFLRRVVPKFVERKCILYVETVRNERDEMEYDPELVDVENNWANINWRDWLQKLIIYNIQ